MYKRTIGDMLRAVITDTQENPGARLYDFTYVIASMALHQWFDLERYWYMFQEFFDIILEREKKEGVHCGRSEPAQEFPEFKDVSHLIHNLVNILSDITYRRRYSIEEFLQDLSQLPVEENLYSNMPLLKEHLLHSFLVEHYFYYLHSENENTWILRRIHVSDFQKDWKPEQGKYVCRYYPETDEKKVMYNKVQKMIHYVGKEQTNE